MPSSCTRYLAWLLSAMSLTVTMGVGRAQAAEITVSGSPGALSTDQDDEQARYWAAGRFWIAGGPVIFWRVPVFQADGAVLPTPGLPTFESKLGIRGGVLTSRTFKGFSVSGTGRLGSFIHAGGSGGGNAGRVYHSAHWTVVAGGHAVSGGGSFAVKAVGTDPWDLGAADFDQVTSPRYKLYVPFSLLGASYTTFAKPVTGTSGFSFEVGYETASGLDSLLHASVENGLVDMSSSANLAGRLSIYQLNSDDATPLDGVIPGHLVSVAQLKAELQADMQDGTLNNPLHLGFLLQDMPVPHADMGDGVVARIHVGSEAHESGVTPVPEPGSFALALAGLCVVGGLSVARTKRRGRKV